MNERIALFGAGGKMGARLSKNLLVDLHPAPRCVRPVLLELSAVFMPATRRRPYDWFVHDAHWRLDAHHRRRA